MFIIFDIKSFEIVFALFIKIVLIYIQNFILEVEIYNFNSQLIAFYNF